MEVSQNITKVIQITYKHVINWIYKCTKKTDI